MGPYSIEELRSKVASGALGLNYLVQYDGETEWRSTVGAILGTGTPSQPSQSPAPQSPAAATSAALLASDIPTSAVCRRYQNGYLVATATTAIGIIVKSVGIGFGILILLACVIVGSQTDRIAAGVMAGVVCGAIVAIPLYVLGVLVSAQGEVLKATLDTAVHGSPFLKKEDMARVMSL